MSQPLVSIIMGSQSDWATMQEAASLLDELEIPYEAKVVSAHRTPDRLVEFSRSAEQRGIKAVIAGAGGAAHLPGMVAAMTIVPVIAIPVQSKALNGMDSLLSIVQMPRGVCVATQAIGGAGAFNGALMAAQILSLQDSQLNQRLKNWRENQTQNVSEEIK
jgi:5-(carboxyamino)imidazole ribonucleotide mutase